MAPAVSRGSRNDRKRENCLPLMVIKRKERQLLNLQEHLREISRRPVSSATLKGLTHIQMEVQILAKWRT